MKVTSIKKVIFPKLKFTIGKGEEKELPKDEKAQAIILRHPYISKVEKMNSQRNTQDNK